MSGLPHPTDWNGCCDGCHQKKAPEEIAHWGLDPATAYYCRDCWRAAQQQIRLRFAVAFSLGFVAGIVVALLMVHFRLS